MLAPFHVVTTKSNSPITKIAVNPDTRMGNLLPLLGNGAFNICLKTDFEQGVSDAPMTTIVQPDV